MHERRRDPRTSKPYSLMNLLKTRAERDGLLLAVVGTPDGWVMASSRDRADKQGARLAAHASAELFGGAGREVFVLAPDARPEMRLLGMRIEVDGRPAFVAVIVGSARSFSLDELAGCVKRILGEPAQEKVAA